MPSAIAEPQEIHVGLDLPHATARQIYQWARKQDWPEGTQLEHQKDYHVTLMFSTEGREHKDAWWIEHLDAAEVSVNGVTAFPSGEKGGFAYVLLLEAPEVSEKATEMQERGKAFGLPIRDFDGGYQPHVTVAYGPSPRLNIETPNFTFDVGPSSVSPMRPKESAMDDYGNDLPWWETAKWDNLLNSQQIAERYGLVPSAISNYQTRYPDFPQSILPPGQQWGKLKLFPTDQVDAWFKRRGQGRTAPMALSEPDPRWMGPITEPALEQPEPPGQEQPWSGYKRSDPDDIEENPPRGSRLASAPPEPPNYRKQDKPSEHCGNCKMMFEGKCWGYGNKPVENDHVCDSWAKEEKRSAYNPDEVKILDHLSLTNVAANLHYKFAEGDLDSEGATEYAKKLLQLIGYPTDGITVKAAIDAWQKLYPGDKLLNPAPPTVPTESFGYGTTSGLAIDPKRLAEIREQGRAQTLADTRMTKEEIAASPGFGCHYIAPMVQTMYPDAKHESGIILSRDDYIDHHWNRLPDGTIVDATYDRILPPDHPDQHNYVGYGELSENADPVENPEGFGRWRNERGEKFTSTHSDLSYSFSKRADLHDEVLPSWENKGFTVLHEETPEQVHLHTVELPPDTRGQGYGHRFMDNIKHYVDQNGKPLVVDPVFNPQFFDKFDWLNPTGERRYEYQPQRVEASEASHCLNCGHPLEDPLDTCPECRSTVPSQVNNPEDHIPDFGQRPPDQKRDVQFGNDFNYR